MSDGIELPRKQNIDKDQLVIYYEQTPTLPGPSVQIDKFELISKWTGAPRPLTVLDATQKVGDIAVAVKELTSKTDAPSAPAPTPPAEPSVIQNYAGAVQAKLLVATDNVRELPSVTDERLDNPINPLTNKLERQTITNPDGSKVTITTETPSKLRDLFGAGDKPRVSVEATPASPPPTVTPPAPKEVEPIDFDDEDKIAPPDGHVGYTSADAARRDIMNHVKTMTFSSAAAQEAYLAAEMERVGVHFDPTTPASTGTNVGPEDPLGIQDHLRSSGVTNERLIAQVLAEANIAVRAFEAFIRECQADLSSLDSEVDGYTDQLNAKLSSWDGELKSRLSANPPAGGAAWQSLDVVGGVATVLSPDTDSSQATIISPTGLLIRAGLGNVKANPEGTTLSVANIEQGQEFIATPITSMFGKDAWKTRA